MTTSTLTARHPSHMDYSRGPLLVTWELTRACQLHCRHCRARALRHRDQSELDLDEIRAVLDRFAEFPRPPVVVFTGGDPLERPDLDDIIRASCERGYPTALAPSVTPRLTPAVIERWAALGVRSVSLSLDGARAAVHDGFRGVPGTFEATLSLGRAVVAAGLKLQINTSVSPYTVDDLPEMGRLVETLGVSSWEVFFVIPTGRARLSEALDADAQERALEWLARYQAARRFRVTAVGAPQFIRVKQGRQAALGPPVAREARGLLFISHTGEVYPSGYLPASAGNVRATSVVDLYQSSDLFTGLRDVERLEGQCGTCAWRSVCGGSRARAFAVTGDLYASDPNCPARPA